MTTGSPARRQRGPQAARTVVFQLTRKLRVTYRVGAGVRMSRLLAWLVAPFSSLVLALPAGMTVGAGQVTATRPSAQSLVLNQSTDKAILNWQSFGIASGEAVRFVQPGAGSVALNRVTGGDPSAIFGSLSANGQIFLVNPAGILFAPGAQVNAGSIVASTLSLSNSDFLAGRYQFGGASGAGVSNAGTINAARGGYVLLAAPQVSNSGSISADAGSVGLVTGQRVAIDTSGAGLVRFSVDAAAVHAAASNSGTLAAPGGQVAMLASSLGDAMATVVNQTGVIRAESAVERDGMIVLSGGANGVTRLAGTLNAAGQAGRTGGTVHVLGDKVELTGTARIDASGPAGGGTVLVGGDWQGKNPDIANAARTHIGAGAVLLADASGRGDGGKVVVWADGDTRQLGGISARGGPLGGNGGMVEVSGKQLLDLRGTIDVAAPQGRGGKVLLDPQDILINTSTQTAPPSNGNGTPDVAFADLPDPGTYTVQVADVTGYSELYLQANRNITVASALAMAAGNSVRFEAGNTIAVNAALSASGGVRLDAANITSTAAGTISATGAANTNAGNVTLNATGSVSLAGNVSATGGTASGANPGRNGGTISITGTTVALGAATLTASGSNAVGATSNPGGAGGTITLNATNGITGTGAITASGGNGITGPANGGAAGTITIANNTAGNITVGALSARSGNGVTTGAAVPRAAFRSPTPRPGPAWARATSTLRAAATAAPARSRWIPRAT
ncbi:MAG: filamentous hemagglutinin N-terminal domain-containing protein [Ramlibacter sp.]|jgi:filamentous hemagglutinin family protein|nr:filamentous hemagglutinin N-terminal domain-containing protein [Ramlibacter sp.]